VFRTIQEAINILSNISNKEIRLPQGFITNINIEENKKWLNSTLLEIYQEFKVITTLERWIEEHSVDPESEAYLRKLLDMSYKEAFESYLKSTRYISDYNYIKQREGEKYAILYDYVSKVFVNYFLFGKGNKKKNPTLDQKHQRFETVSCNNGEKRNLFLKFKKRRKIRFIKIQP
jgi:hypothetical protein